MIGEYTPHAKKAGKRIPDGPPVADYYPAVAPLSLWQKVQDARMAFAQSKFGEALHCGRNKFSTKNLFRKLVWDVENDVSMVCKQYNGWACLVSTHREQLREHRIPYRIFRSSHALVPIHGELEIPRPCGGRSEDPGAARAAGKLS